MNRNTTILVHSAVWLILLLWPLSFVNHGNGVGLKQFLMMSVPTLITMIVFYTSYLWLTPHYYVRGNKRFFWIFIIAMIVILGIAEHSWMTYTHELFGRGRRHHEPDIIEHLVTIGRDIFQLVIAAAIATTIQLALRWHKSEEARLQAEAARTKAELKNLRTQINPHFLLNTLNNIYALTAFDSQRAQTAIDQLSKMLRHLLYDDLQEAVNLQDEVHFLQNYVNLMKLRLLRNVDVKLSVSYPEHEVKVMPLLFISLVENAFKHGISPTLPSFVHINLSADEHQIVFDIENSNHPKNEQDRSGHGIGLSQVQRRLDLSYPEHYTWERGVSADGKVYHSKISIRL